MRGEWLGIGSFLVDKGRRKWVESERNARTGAG